MSAYTGVCLFAGTSQVVCRGQSLEWLLRLYPSQRLTTTAFSVSDFLHESRLQRKSKSMKRNRRIKKSRKRTGTEPPRQRRVFCHVGATARTKFKVEMMTTQLDIHDVVQVCRNASEINHGLIYGISRKAACSVVDMNDDKKSKTRLNTKEMLPKMQRHTLWFPHWYSFGRPNGCEWEIMSAVIR